MTKLTIIKQILIEDYNIMIPSIPLSNEYKMFLLQKIKDKEFELLINMLDEYYVDIYFCTYAIQSKYFTRLFENIDNIIDCIQEVIKNNDKLIICRYEIERALIESINIIKFEKKYKNPHYSDKTKHHFIYIIKTAIYYYFPNIIIKLNELMDGCPSIYYFTPLHI